MKTAVVYYSKHHENTKKLLEAIAEKNEVTLIDVTENPAADLSEFDRIGFASGIYYSKFQKTLLKFAEKNMPENKEVFFIYTCGAEKSGYTKAIAEAVMKNNAKILGEFGCLGFDTFGPFKLVGGIAKGHPDQRDLENAVKFYERL
ncbi:MAG: flavodoxin family protein [Ruminiclostridium sp.]